MPDLLAWLRSHPWQADSLLALLLVVTSSGQWQWQGQGSAVSQVAVTAFSVLLAATVVPRRPYPVAMFAVAAAIEAMAYFCAAELLANVAKHSGASRATVNVREHVGRILMTVTDDGSGGAHLAPGGGLAGLLERVQAVDGRLSVDSPAGGPTAIAIELPGHA